ncbi:MAG: hypothetical protein M3072_16785 [Candidatus Dormibacteraeota bacterium]|nr:hypothetical protein [Candidatus Dormibacteraeota bacterium]
MPILRRAGWNERTPARAWCPSCPELGKRASLPDLEHGGHPACQAPALERGDLAALLRHLLGEAGEIYFPKTSGRKYVAVGPDGVDDLTAEIDAWREAGGSHVSVMTMGLGLDSVDGHIEYLASVADALTLP